MDADLVRRRSPGIGAVNNKGKVACAKATATEGGETGIRTLDTIAGTTVFETVPFNHSGISPKTINKNDGNLIN